MIREPPLCSFRGAKTVVSVAPMPATPAFHFSMLTRQFAFGSDAFSRRYPHCWLVWEAGGTPGRPSDVSLSVLETAVAGTRKQIPRPGNDDSLCFALKARGSESLRVGRAVENELVIPEPTVSRLHAELEPR